MTSRPTAHGWRRRTLQTALGAVVVATLAATSAGTALAVPPPPPNPSDSDIAAAGSAVDSQAGRVGGLISDLVSAQSALQSLDDEVATKKNLAVKALVDLQTAQDAATAAAGAVTTAQQALAGAVGAIEVARTQVDAFAAGSYQQGSTVGGFSAYLGSSSPEDVLVRAQLLSAVGENQQGVMRDLERARTQQANADSAARAAQQRADDAATAATGAKAAADGAIADAQAAQADQAARTGAIAAQRDSAQAALDAARQDVSGLQGQRAAFEAWDAQRQAEEAAAQAAAQEQARLAAEAQSRADAQAAAQRAQDQQAAQAAAQQAAQQAAARAAAAQAAAAGAAQDAVDRAAAAAAAAVPAASVTADTSDSDGGSGSAGSSSPPPAPAEAASAAGGSRDEKVQAVIDRGMTQLGVRYSWGGGNASGPTVGVRDGGVADSYGDFRSVGFDCSGLMVYAFAAVGINLPKFSGYQYTAGPRVPASQMQAGDMLFWGAGGSQHVALYLGDGQMLESPQSGSSVRVSPVRSGYLSSVTRMIS